MHNTIYICICRRIEGSTRNEINGKLQILQVDGQNDLGFMTLNITEEEKKRNKKRKRKIDEIVNQGKYEERQGKD